MGEAYNWVVSICLNIPTRFLVKHQTPVCIITMMCGGFTNEADPASEEHQAIADSVRADIEAKLGTSFTIFKVISYKSQVVAGTNFLMKIQVSEAADGFIHAGIFRPLPYTGQPPEVSDRFDLVGGKSFGDPIEF